MPWNTGSLSERLSSFFFSFVKGSGFLSDSEVQDGATCMHIPKQQGLPFWFSSHPEDILSYRDSGNTLEFTKSSQQTFDVCTSLIWKDAWRHQDCCVDAPDTDSKQRDRRREEAMGMRRGLSWCLQIWMLQCAKERRDVNSSDCLQEAASNLNMMKLIWFYRLEFLSDRNGWG